MGSGDDKNVLQHLLHLEAEASALVDGAQIEADRRLSEAEAQCRKLYDQNYSAEVERLESVYINEIAKIKEDYKNRLNAYRDELKARSVNRAAFNVLADQYLGKN